MVLGCQCRQSPGILIVMPGKPVWNLDYTNICIVTTTGRAASSLLEFCKNPYHFSDWQGRTLAVWGAVVHMSHWLPLEF